MIFRAKFDVCSVFLALGVALLAACSSDHVVSGTDVVAKWKACSGSTDGLRNAGRTTLENSNWSEGKLIVNVKDNDYCGGTRITNPRYALDGKIVQLSWGWELGPGKAVTACTCDLSVRFELANLPPGEYQIDSRELDDA